MVKKVMTGIVVGWALVSGSIAAYADDQLECLEMSIEAMQEANDLAHTKGEICQEKFPESAQWGDKRDCFADAENERKRDIMKIERLTRKCTAAARGY